MAAAARYSRHDVQESNHWMEPGVQDDDDDNNNNPLDRTKISHITLDRLILLARVVLGCDTLSLSEDDELVLRTAHSQGGK